jgi:hypothetical protein
VKQLEHLKGRNQNLNSFCKNKGASTMDFEQQKALEDQYRASADNLLKKKNDLDSIKKDYDSEMQRFGEISAQVPKNPPQNNSFIFKGAAGAIALPEKRD